MPGDFFKIKLPIGSGERVSLDSYRNNWFWDRNWSRKSIFTSTPLTSWDREYPDLQPYIGFLRSSTCYHQIPMNCCTTKSTPIWKTQIWSAAAHLANNYQSSPESSSSNGSMISLTIKTLHCTVINLELWYQDVFGLIFHDAPHDPIDLINLPITWAIHATWRWGTSILRATCWCRQTSRRTDESNEKVDDKQRASHSSTTIFE
jgi:hypothetical protein